MFNATTFLLGLLVLISAFLIHRAHGQRLFSILLVIMGVAAMGVGILPGDTGVIHGLAALAAFVTSSLSAIAAHRLEKRPLNYISVIIGIFSLTVLFLALFMG
jgi:hypothetical membrane protein